MDAAEAVHSKLMRRIADGDLPERTASVAPAAVGLSAEAMVEIFYTQCATRQLDRISRRLQARGEGFYTIGSSGHENNAAVAEALRLDDMAFLHYRSTPSRFSAPRSCLARRRAGTCCSVSPLPLTTRSRPAGTR